MKKKAEAQGKIWLSHNISKYKPWIITLTVLTVLATLCSVGFAYLSGSLVNSAVDKRGNSLIAFAFIVVGLLFLRILLRAVINYFSEKCRATIVTEIRGKLFKRVLRAEYLDVKDYHSGDVITRVTADTSEVAGATVSLLPQTVGIILQIVGAIIALFVIDIWFTVFFIVGGIVIITISAFLRKKTKWYYKEIVSADSQSRAFMQESVVSSLTVKAFGAEEKTSQKANSILDVYKKRRLGRARLNSLILK